MTKVASIIKYRGDREKAIHWMLNLPVRYNNYELTTILDSVEKGKYLLWTEDNGIRIV